MAEASSRDLFTGEQVFHLLDAADSDEEAFDDDIFFPGSDDELGFIEEEVEHELKFVKSKK